MSPTTVAVKHNVVIQAIVVAIVIGLGVINVHSLWIYELLPTGQCAVDPRRTDFEAVAWPWVNAVVAVYAPSVIGLVVASLTIVTRRRSPTTTAASRQSSCASSQPSKKDSQAEAELTALAVRLGLIYAIAALVGELLHVLRYISPPWLVFSNSSMSVMVTATYISAIGTDLVTPSISFAVGLSCVTSLRSRAAECIRRLITRLVCGCGCECGRCNCRCSLLGHRLASSPEAG
jgi:hypothetical protein